MIKKSAVLLVILGLIGASYVFANASLLIGEAMSAESVGKKWGREPFDSEKFKNGDMQTRAKMAYAMVKEPKRFIGKSVTEIRSMLGEHDGHYVRDSVPAYMIDLGKKPDEDGWQIVLLTDRKSKVRDVVVLKN